MKLLSIGQFAARVGLSVTALRFYAEQDLLRPTQVDPDSGYRYYAPEQIAVGRRVAELRRLGLPLRDLTHMLSAAPEDAARILERHEQRLFQDFQAKPSLLKQVGERLSGQRQLPAVELRHQVWPAQLLLSATISADAPDFADAYLRRLGELQSQAHSQRVSPAGADFGLYPGGEYLGGPILAEVYLPVQSTCMGRGHLRFMAMASVEVAYTLHSGDWRSFGVTFAALSGAMAAAGHCPGVSYKRSTPQGVELGFLLA
ncbi:MerR family transcriptional regulator [uncultured Deinococcus sp.]|uniref:MerR family transcriptional regulator n=1 Tax=uncultured Deinococcus sp. TaxID=158789 RepID=UPI002582D191|nr:MerR family transcriptional regulator [uncultured Deinococcus sp.]